MCINRLWVERFWRRPWSCLSQHGNKNHFLESTLRVLSISPCSCVSYIFTFPPPQQHSRSRLHLNSARLYHHIVQWSYFLLVSHYRSLSLPLSLPLSLFLSLCLDRFPGRSDLQMRSYLVRENRAVMTHSEPTKFGQPRLCIRTGRQDASCFVLRLTEQYQAGYPHIFMVTQVAGKSWPLWRNPV